MHNIDLKNLSKKFPSGFELGPLDYSFKAGKTTVVLGKNGAGKSTLFQLLTGSSDASAGEIHLGSERMIPENFRLKKACGYLPQNLALPKWASPRELLYYAGQLREGKSSHAKVLEAASYWDASQYLDKPVQACSYGMAKRVGLALATIHHPKFLILDEPSSGLDIFHIKALDNYISKRKSEGLLTILSTHDAHHAAKNGDEAIILENGKMNVLEIWPTLNILDRIQAIEEIFFNTRPST